MNKKLVNLSLTGLFAAIIFLATFLFKIPLPSGYGYVNFGDGFILACVLFLGAYAVPAAAIGSFLADLIAGYGIYAPATFVIKGLCALAAWIFIVKIAGKFKYKAISYILGAVFAESLMAVGYFLFEWALYGFSAALSGMPFNLIQGICSIVIFFALAPIVKKIKI